jgi:hypothetical protein
MLLQNWSTLHIHSMDLKFRHSTMSGVKHSFRSGLLIVAHHHQSGSGQTR